MAENLYAMRCTEFFGTRCANAHSAATKNSKLAKGLNLMRNKLSIAKKGMSLRRKLNKKEQKLFDHVGCFIRTPHKRSRSYLLNSYALCIIFILEEFIRMHISLDLIMFQTWS